MKKVALVTGSSQGIGKGIALKLAENGYITFVTYLKNKLKGENAAKEITKKGGIAELVKLDVKSEESVKKVFEKITNDYGSLNVLVNNAGIEVAKSIESISFDEWKDVVDTKINGNFLCTKYAIPLMKNQENANLIGIVSAVG